MDDRRGFDWYQFGGFRESETSGVITTGSNRLRGGTTLVVDEGKKPDRVWYCIGNGQLHDALSISKEVCKTLNCLDDQMKVLEVKGEGMEEKEQLAVRRLTPEECELLQGFPKGYTDLGEWTDSKGKVHKTTDSNRYRCLGNSIGIPAWMHIIFGISKQYEGTGHTPTMGSLFDGIGGFPRIWEHYNGKGTARWASEIEEFPIAVTKKWFPEEEQNDESN